MKYRFYGDTLQLIRYELTVTQEHDGDEYTEAFTAVTDKEKDSLLQRYPGATVTKIDNTGYEWLDGMTFTQEQLRNGELEKAIDESNLDEYKADYQEKNKLALATYLKDNPILWTDGKYYGVTQEDQIEMQTDLTAYNLKQQSGDTDWKLEWHDIKKACREFTVEEFMGLMNAIVDYVYPLRKLQESYKELIYATSDKSQLALLQFNYNINDSNSSEEPSIEEESNETEEESVVVDTIDEDVTNTSEVNE